MLLVGLTGGIGAGKSSVSRRLAARGAVVIDADLLAREVVAVGTPGLAQVVEAFGGQVLTPEGSLDREALGAVVFADPVRRQQLNGIVHPLIGAETALRMEAAHKAGAAVVVHDVPLLVEGGLAPAYHLVVVVGAPTETRMQRLTALRGMDPEQAQARIAAQADDDQRRTVADVWLENVGSRAALHRQVDQLWASRLVPYADNLAHRRWASRRRGPALRDPDPGWAAEGARLVARLQAVCGPTAQRVTHIGSTAVPGLAAKDIVDVQVEVAAPDDADALREPLGEAGFPRLEEVLGDPPRPEIDPDPAQWWKRFHRSADPGRAANVHVRLIGSASARCGVALPELLRTNPDARATYETAKRRLAAEHPDDVDAYAEAKTEVLVPLLRKALMHT